MRRAFTPYVMSCSKYALKSTLGLVLNSNTTMPGLALDLAGVYLAAMKGSLQQARTAMLTLT